jgi:dimethylaniline monooxygenase (N-oxide forming)
MRTNTSRITTCFSELPHDVGSPTYPTSEAMGEYLQRYAEQFDLTRHIRLKTPVREFRRDEDHGWIVRTDTSEERFEKIVIATGRYNNPAIPDVPGLKSFSGVADVSHTFSYKRPEDYHGLRALVTGCAISSVEIASDLAALGAARVVLTNQTVDRVGQRQDCSIQRRQRPRLRRHRLRHRLSPTSSFFER